MISPMLFRRRHPEAWFVKVRTAMWPRRSWSRSLAYVFKRIIRITATPHAIAAGVAAGVFSSFTPFMGLHILLALAIAWLIAGNLPAAALGTFVGNPLTFPLIWASTWEVGHKIAPGVHHDKPELTEAGFVSEGVRGLIDNFQAIWEPVLKPMTIGAIPLGLFFSLVTYFAVRALAIRYRHNRRERIAAKAARLALLSR
jgi:uncharacterized protein (DUF2062 family)